MESRNNKMQNNEDEDYQLALQIQFGYDGHDEESVQIIEPSRDIQPTCSKQEKSLSIVHSEWETIDPNPDVRALFLEFNGKFFWGKLLAVEVRWSPRMTSCAGLCCYEGRGGLCSVRLSEPLLKLRPRKDLIETLLHEMIHAFLFVTNNNRDHDAHGPEFCKHMQRINQSAGTNITIYHSFHDEVRHYQQHWWRCEGVCRNQKPFYGFVKRAMNRAPAPTDRWWADHQRSCGGQFVKVKEPPQEEKKKRKNETKSTDDDQRKRPKNQPSIDSFVRKKTADSSPPSSSSSSSQPVVSEAMKFPGKGHVLGTAALAIKKEENRPVQRPAAKAIPIPQRLIKVESERPIKKDNEPSQGVPKKAEAESSIVPCPICKREIQSSMINSHLDECLTLAYLKQ